MCEIVVNGTMPWPYLDLCDRLLDIAKPTIDSHSVKFGEILAKMFMAYQDILTIRHSPNHHASANSDFGYVTLCDTTAAIALCAKGTLLQVTTDKFKYKVK